MIGSLNKIWPWKENLTYVDSHGHQVPLLRAKPLACAKPARNRAGPIVVAAISLAIGGVALVLGLN
jgi:hypothetical protein